MPRRSCVLLAVAVLAVCQIAARAEDAFYDVPLTDLKITAGEMQKPDEIYSGWGGFWESTGPSVWLDGAGEAYLQDDFSGNGRGVQRLHARAEKGKEVTGRLLLRTGFHKPMAMVKFSLPASQAKAEAETPFYNAKIDYYQNLERRPIAGRAWFRHEAIAANDRLESLNKKKGTKGEQRFFADGREIVDAYDLFSGGQAISESLQLDRALRENSKDRSPAVAISTLTGITVAAIDWKPLLKDAKPELDPLAKMIPADQHVVFFPSFAAAARLADEMKSRDVGIMLVAKPQSEDLGIFKKYERQLGIGITAVGRMVGPKLIKSIAVTGSDPYFPTGTDVAVVFESEQPDVLVAAIRAQIGVVASKVADAKPTSGTESGVKYDGFRSPNREVCSYVARLNGAVVVTNSLTQLKQLASAAKDNGSIASLDEYKFFRTRYPLGDKDETAFLFLSDAAIRRWCSPQWRIASGRRTFTAAAMSELTAEHVKELESGKLTATKLHTDLPLVDAGELTLTKNGVVSSTQGSFDFMTPIVEMPIEKVSKAEAEAYNRWRDQYQSNWRWAFDPIAFRIGVGDDKLSGDLTVMPLIAGSEYREYLSVSRGAEITAAGSDLHDTLAHVALAINKDSEPMKRWGNMASAFAPGARIEPFGWLGSTVSLYADDDPVWEKLRGMSDDEREKFLRKNPGVLPIALHADVSSAFKLTAFLAAARGFIEQAAPGMVTWEPITYREQSYVKVKPTEQARRGLGEETDFALFYAPSAQGLTLSLNEDLIKRAIDRRIDGAKEKDNSIAKADSAKAAVVPWIGKNLCLRVDQRMFEILNSLAGMWWLSGPNPETALQLRSWSNLPILNEWKRLFPDDDPVKVHERLWHTTLVCPGGGKYAWNDEWKTMESDVYGHPGQPKEGPRGAPSLMPFENANFGLTFEEHGLRARAEFTKQKK